MSDTPNVLFIGVDQLRADNLGCYGNPICETPNLDALGRDGVLFERAYTPCSLCTPARASMLTGLFAFTHGMGTNCDMYHSLAAELPQPDQLLHYRLLNLGYRCGFTGKWHVGTRRTPVDYGFEGMNVPGYGDLKRDPGYQMYLRENGLHYGPVLNPIYANANQKTLSAGTWNGPLESTPTHYLTNYTLNLLEDLAADERPFFLTCQYWAPHGPCLPSPEFKGRHDRQKIEPWINYGDDLTHKPTAMHRRQTQFYRQRPQTWEEWREVVGLYYDYTALVDHEIGRLVDRLNTLGLADNTIVVFTSDHGDMTGSHGGLIDKGFMYEEAHRVPLIVRWPARYPGGARRDQLVYNMDIMPTILDAVGKADPTLDGKSLVPYLEMADTLGRDGLLLEFHGLQYLYSQRAWITQDRHKYIFTPGDWDEVYDLNTDPGERHNLLPAGQTTPLADRLRAGMHAAAIQACDPLRDYLAKVHGDWENVSNQPDASRAILKSSTEVQ
jgi:choline-sulfatase